MDGGSRWERTAAARPGTQRDAAHAAATAPALTTDCLGLCRGFASYNAA